MRLLRSKIVWLLVLSSIGGVFGWRYLKARGDSAPHYQTAAVDRGRVVTKVTASGTLSALVTVQVGSQVSGRLAEVKADFNSTVKKGQVIAKLDPQLFAAAVEQAHASRVAAGANLAKAKVAATDADRQYARSKGLLDKGIIAQQDLDTLQSASESARAQVQAAASQVTVAAAAEHQARVNLDYTTIVAPIDGVVISRNVDQGQTVAASLSAPTLFTIAQDLGKMQVDTSVGESDVGKLTAGMAATFTVDAYPGARFKGTVRQIRNAPTTVQNVVTYDAVIDVDNADLRLKPGMTANVTLVTVQKDDVLRVPNAALRFRPTAEMVAAQAPSTPAAAPAGAPAGAQTGGRRGGGAGRGAGGGAGDSSKKTVYTLIGGQPQAVSIVTGATDGTYTELVSGDLKEGAQLVTDSDGTPATPSAKKAAPAAGRIL